MSSSTTGTENAPVNPSENAAGSAEDNKQQEQEQTKKRGAFIVLEGCDKAGKSTQVKMLVDRLAQEGVSVEPMRFPDRTTDIGRMCDSYLRMAKELDDHAIHLIFAANRWESRSRMLRLLNAGTTIICDRYSFSGIAFSATKSTMDLEWCKGPEIGLPAPDAVYFLDLAVEDAQKRGEFGDEIYETLEKQRLVRQSFLDMAQENWTTYDARKTIQEVHEQIFGDAKKLIEQVAQDEAPVGELSWGK